MTDMCLIANAAWISSLSVTEVIYRCLSSDARIRGYPYYHRVVSPYVLAALRFRQMAYMLHWRHSGGTVYSANDQAVVPLNRLRVIWKRPKSAQ